MTSTLAVLLHFVLSLLVSVQGNTSLSVVQQQQAITVATHAKQVVAQTLQNSSSSSSSSSSSTASSSTATTTSTTTLTVAKNDGGSPVRLIIPALSIDAGFQFNGLKPDGTMEVPSNIYDVGWYTGSARPGDKGVAIVTGHVAQIRREIVTKPGVFSSLYELVPGDKLTVVNDKGESIAFVVREIRSYDPTADATDVFRATDGGAHLNIVTCEGTWNQAQLSYTERLVVFTDAVQ